MEKLIKIKGVGVVIAAKLRRKGLGTIGAIATATPGELVIKSELSLTQARNMINSARKVMKDIPGNIKKKTVRGVKKVGKTRKLEGLKKKKVQTLKAKENVKDKIQYAKVLHDKQKQAEKVKVENQRNELTETLLATLFNEVKAGRRSLKISGLDDLIEEATNSHGFKGEILSALMKEKSFRHRVIDMVAEEIK